MSLVINDVRSAFPIVWDNPEDAAHSWKRDVMHFPRPVSRLTQSFGALVFKPGFDRAARELSLPIRAAHMRFHNGFEYDRMEMVVPTTEAEAAARAERSETIVRDAMGRQLERWHGEFRPRIVTNHARLRQITKSVATSADPRALVDEVTTILSEDWHLHFLIVTPMTLAMQLFDELYVDLFGGDAADAHVLLTGQTSKSVETGIALSDLAAQARGTGLKDLMLSLPPDEVMTALQMTGAGRDFAAQVESFLDCFGLRQDVFDIATPTWQENPSIAFASIQAYLVSGHDMSAAHNAAIENADAALHLARARMVALPQPVRQQFESLLQAARAANFLQEEHNFFIDQQATALSRLFFLELGERLVQMKKLTKADDILMLSLEEIDAALMGSLDLRWELPERWDTYAAQQHLIAPPFIGAPPAAPPPMDNPMMRGTMRFFGGPPQVSDSPNTLKGNAGSRGTVRGIARVALSLDEAKGLQPGEILVALTTMPAWTPLFGIAAAIVTETGGPLCHGAIVAREYGIPAVVGAFGATTVITTGQTIVVDGSTGLVTLE